MSVRKGDPPSGNRIERHMLVCTVGATNHNKFWRCDLYDSHDVDVSFGRIGVTETWQVPVKGRSGGREFMEAQMRAKKRGKVNKKTGEREPYTEIEVVEDEGGIAATPTSRSSAKIVDKTQLRKLASSQIDHAKDAETAKLLDWLVDVNRHQIEEATKGKVQWNAKAGMFKTPLGFVTPNAIDEARKLLSDIANFVVAGKTGADFEKVVDRYLTIIPHNLGMKRWPDTDFMSSVHKVQDENQLLDALAASYQQATSIPIKKTVKVTDAPRVFQAKLTIESDPKVIEEIAVLYKKTLSASHVSSRFKIKKIWAVRIETIAAAFDHASKRIGNIKKLWHGTQASNLLSILKVGLVIPPSSSSHVTGRMFGDGLYFSDQSTKALNYATNFWGGGDLGRYFMFLAHVAMGAAYTPSTYGGRLPAPGYDSTFAKAGRSGVRNNEMIVYNTNQANLVFLAEFGK